ncbi:MAG: Na+/H+ antiporter subunit D [Melioribacteraceae bacterium]|nr:Na+/H+ antiporter subunit D [Melioribacteraceae bacterium]
MKSLTNILLVAPILLPFLSAIIMLSAWKKIKFQRVMNLFASGVAVMASLAIMQKVRADGILVLHVGGWQAPFGISIVIDLLSAIMVVITAVIAFVTAIYSIHTIDPEREAFGFYPLLQFLLMGINGAFITGDLFNLYVWFEVMLISSFVLIALGGRKDQLEGAIKYVTLNLLASAIFLAAAGIIYGLAGTLNMADLARKLPLLNNDTMLNLVSVMFLISFGIKSALFPFFFWLPASYHTPPAAVSAIFAGLLTKVGVYALIRVFTLIFTHDVNFTHTVLLVLAGLTMLSGVLGAATQMDFRRILSFHIISQIGYMIMGLALNSPLALAGGIFYIMHHVIVKTNLFFVSGMVNKFEGSYRLKSLGGVFKASPVLSLLFFIPAMSLAGIPPLSGFWAKFTVAKAGFDLEQYFIVGVSLLVGALTLYSMTKIWNEVFWKDKPDSIQNNNTKESWSSVKLYLPLAILSLITIIIGFNAEPFLNLAINAAHQLLNPQEYIKIVLGS